jgi:hypothetical protein
MTKIWSQIAWVAKVTPLKNLIGARYRAQVVHRAQSVPLGLVQIAVRALPPHPIESHVIQHDCGGHGNIETLDETIHRNKDTHVCSAVHCLADSLALIAEKDRCRNGKVALHQVAPLLGMRRHNAMTRLPQALDTGFDTPPGMNPQPLVDDLGYAIGFLELTERLDNMNIQESQSLRAPHHGRYVRLVAEPLENTNHRRSSLPQNFFDLVPSSGGQVHAEARGDLRDAQVELIELVEGYSLVSSAHHHDVSQHRDT